MAEGSGAMPRLLCTIHSYAFLPKLGGTDKTAIHTLNRRYQSETDRFVRLPGPAVTSGYWSPASRPVTTPFSYGFTTEHGGSYLAVSHARRLPFVSGPGSGHRRDCSGTFRNVSGPARFLHSPGGKRRTPARGTGVGT